VFVFQVAINAGCNFSLPFKAASSPVPCSGIDPETVYIGPDPIASAEDMN
jgi:hypothetical protein